MTPEREAQMREMFVQWMKTREGYPFAGAFANLMWGSWLACARALEPKWLPIETAPKDREAWAFNGEQSRMKWSEGPEWALWIYADQVLSDVDPEPIQPTHWMPLPEQPKAAMSAALEGGNATE